MEVKNKMQSSIWSLMSLMGNVENYKAVLICIISSIIIFHYSEKVNGAESGKHSLYGSIKSDSSSILIMEKGEAIGTANFSDCKITIELSPDNKSITKVVVYFEKIDLNVVRKEQGVKVTQTNNLKGSSYYFNGPFKIENNEFAFEEGGTTCNGLFLSSKEASGTIHLLIDVGINNGTLSVDFGDLKWEAKA